jgi:hypothetical protein
MKLSLGGKMELGSINRKEVLVSQLLLDNQNPRLPISQVNQRDTIRAMLSSQPEKIITLANHIIVNGVNPSSLPIIMPSNEKGYFTVLDGNRRVTALKLLESPSLGDDLLTQNLSHKLKTLSNSFKDSPINKLVCIVVASREDADTWIELVHRGENEGAGTVQWDGQVSARYDARRSGNTSIALQVIDLMSNHPNLIEKTKKKIETGKFPITTLSRLLSTPYVREKLGIQSKEGKLYGVYPSQEISKGLSHILNDLGTGNVTVSDIKRQSQRIDYINSFSKEDLPNSETKTGLHPIVLQDNDKAKSSSITKIQQPASNRSTLIPKKLV